MALEFSSHRVFELSHTFQHLHPGFAPDRTIMTRSFRMGGLFAPKPAPLPPAPEVKPVAPMPVADPNSPAQREARRRANADIMARAGRSSTILTAPGDRGGAADNYSSPKLG